MGSNTDLHKQPTASDRYMRPQVIDAIIAAASLMGNPNRLLKFDPMSLEHDIGNNGEYRNLLNLCNSHFAYVLFQSP